MAGDGTAHGEETRDVQLVSIQGEGGFLYADMRQVTVTWRARGVVWLATARLQRRSRPSRASGQRHSAAARLCTAFQ